MSTELTTRRETTEVESFISKAIDKGASIETLEKLLAMRKELKAEQSKEAFVLAMADFQSKCPVIEKTKKVMNTDGVTVRYKYAPIDAIVEQIKKPLADQGLAYTWTVKNETGKITAICKVTHKLGHSEESSFEIPIDATGYMTAPQKVASALTFAKRYSLCNILGISTGDEDTDATDVNKEKEVKSVKSKIVLQLRTLGNDTKTKASIEKAVIDRTQLELKEENYVEISSRLQVLIDEANENN